MIPLLALLLAAAAEPPAVRPGADPARPVIAAALPRELAGASGAVAAERGERRLRLRLIGVDGTPGPAILGTYRAEGGELRFAPRFALLRGRTYRVERTADDGRDASLDFRVPEPPDPGPAATVEQVFPSGDVLPANHLKFYLHFSRPMREGPGIFDRVRLLDDAGREVADPWRRNELWSEDRRRFTLWIHPGRVKQGVNLREELGPVLREGGRYTLVIDAALPDAEGRPLAAEHRRTFRVGPADRTRPDPSAWTLRPPAAGADGPLTVEFGEPLDRALAERLITVVGPDGKPVAGRAELSDGETVWRFRPLRPWAAGDHTLTVDPRLEDLAGNTPERPFEVDLTARPPAPLPLTRTFRPAGAAR
jgi:hypothetical protein